MRYTKQIVTYATLLFLLSGCSLKSPPDQWRHDSASAFSAYTDNFLRGKEALAKGDLSRAIAHAKSSADLSQLARIYLGVCALDRAVGVVHECRDYQRIAHLVSDPSLTAYHALLSGAITPSLQASLPPAYKSFSSTLYSRDSASISREVTKISKPTSKLIAAAIAKEYLSKETRIEIVKVASYHGYKKVILFWLREEIRHSNDGQTRAVLEEKIAILSSE